MFYLKMDKLKNELEFIRRKSIYPNLFYEGNNLVNLKKLKE